MGVTIFAAKGGVPVLGPGHRLQGMRTAEEQADNEQVSATEWFDASVAAFHTSAGNFVTICELLELPNCVSEFDPQVVIAACDTALLDLDDLLVRQGLGLSDRKFHFRQLMQIRDIALVGRSRGADRIICTY
ncbi:hypothetical protein Q4511_16040 [Paracoccus sp. 1_MG-2023]|uniref:hypothetical protein n=1 Tax=unclassified Paracoccus (in: a-proteobacteria) TaxID=2688777 RepID=UPI001C07EF76|nr:MULTISPECIES: hypothetical protein [unclassified Paracoccus (in: a-proteobacteria)]MBU2956119.1 hypothetical protein [Paracoccus sp. C2R09]MDO6670427.1 hypothetical protein [Paracoccus sp. 1_MG-2023]